MKNESQYYGKNVLILGLAKSGFAAANLLHQLGALVTVNDIKPFEENEQAQLLNDKGIKVICGEHPLNIVNETVDVVVKNPGIPYSNPLIKKALALNIPVITEVEIAAAITEAEIVGVTGSNGKTTTTTLIHEMLKSSHKEPLIAGNIGTVVCEVAANATNHQVLVTELSSFQLLGTVNFRPNIAVMLNIFEAHLDYHGTKEEYVKAKAKLFANQTEKDILIYNADDRDVAEAVRLTKATRIPFSSERELKNGACLVDNVLYYKGESIVNVKDIALPGKHNYENILAAIAVAKSYGVANEHIQDVLKWFTGVKHRLQFVKKLNDRKFYNDSKATNILATQKALSSFSDPVILLAGGLDRGNEFDELIPYLRNVKAVITFGETSEKIKKIAVKAGIDIVKHVDNVEEAVPEAYRYSEVGDVILLSPACASWDQYKTFEQRGDIFIKSVHKLKV